MLHLRNSNHLMINIPSVNKATKIKKKEMQIKNKVNNYNNKINPEFYTFL